MPEEKKRTLLDRLRNLSDTELTDELSRERAKLFNLRRENTTRQLQNTAAISQTRKNIARILTLKRERELMAKK